MEDYSHGIENSRIDEMKKFLEKVAECRKTKGGLFGNVLSERRQRSLEAFRFALGTHENKKLNNKKWIVQPEVKEINIRVRNGPSWRPLEAQNAERIFLKRFSGH